MKPTELGGACFVIRQVDGFFVGYYLNTDENVDIAFGNVPWKNGDVPVAYRSHSETNTKWHKTKNIPTQQEQLNEFKKQR
jgi:hypothetical protein